MENLSQEQIRHDRNIARQGLVILVGGLSFLFGGMYLTKVSETGSFSKTNQYVVGEFQRGYQEHMTNMKRVPMQAFFP